MHAQVVRIHLIHRPSRDARNAAVAHSSVQRVRQSAARYLRVTIQPVAPMISCALVRASVPAAHGVNLVYRSSAAV